MSAPERRARTPVARLAAPIVRRYGASPLHALAHLALLASAAWVVAQLVDAEGVASMLVWLAGAAILHDLVLLPFYSLLDRLGERAAPPGAVNYVRVPLALSALLFLVWFPLILGLSDAAFTEVAGLAPEGYLQRWLGLSALLFGGSALLYAVRVRAAATPASGGR